MPEIDLKVCDLDGNHLTYLTDFGNFSGTVPYNDSRTGKVEISMFDKGAKWIRPLDRVIKAYYGNNPLIFGRILRPSFDFETGVITVDFHDPTIVLKHTYHRFGDYVVDIGYPVDGKGAFWIVESSIPLDGQIDRGVRGNGIMFGSNSTEDQGPKTGPSPGIWGQCIRSENVWDSLQKLAQKNIGPDFEFEPADGLDPGYFVQMNVGAKPDDPEGGDPLGTDRRNDVQFIHGINCNLVWEPDGNAVRNYYVASNPGGERDRHDTAKNKALAHDSASWEQYGIFQGWESVGEKLKQPLLQADANAWVASYSQPPNFVTIKPYQDRESTPQFLRDFKVGDFIKASGRRGEIFIEVSGQVTNATITQSPDEGSKQGVLAIEVAPLEAVTIGTDAEEGE